MKNQKIKTNFVRPKRPKTCVNKSGVNYMIFILISEENYL